jgi:hypothetical protein
MSRNVAAASKKSGAAASLRRVVHAEAEASAQCLHRDAHG